MDLISVLIGVATGFLLGIGAALFYLRWKMKQQLGNFQEQMEGMMEMTEEMNEGFGEEAFDMDEVEEVETEEKEEKE